MGSQTVPLPQYAVLTTAYTQGQLRRRPLLSCRREGIYGHPKNSLEFVFTEGTNITVKFAIERSSINNELVHIRCCYNNKYIVKRTQYSDYLDAIAEKPEEDTSVWSCTLFRPEYKEYSGSYSAHYFKHVQSGNYINSTWTNQGNCFLTHLRPNKPDLVELDVIDWSSIVILPPQVIFKGNNGKYLAVVRHPNSSPNLSGVHRYTLQCTKDDPADPSAKHELELMHDNHEGTLYIKSLSPGLTAPYNQTYWYSATQFSPPRPLYLSGHDRATHSTPVKVNPNSIALRTSNGRFLRCSTSQNNYLYDDGQSLVRETWLQVEEPVLSREIYNVRYRFEDARIYNEIPVIVATAPTENKSPDQTSTNVISFRFEEIRERSWRAFVSLELSYTVGVSFGIPFIGEIGFEVSPAIKGEYEWGETITETLEFSQSYTFHVPPMTHVTAYLVASKGTCDIPFDYTVRDVLMDGTTRIYDAEGGLFTGVNNFNFHTSQESRPLQ